MIIVSQSKSKIINLNNIEMLYLTRVNNKYGNVQSVEVNARGSYDCNLGEYKKEERAKEVLKEIAERYSNWQNMLVGQPQGECNPKYEMPED